MRRSSMSTTTDAISLRRWSFVAYGALALTIWFAGLAFAARAFEPTDAVIVIAPSKRAALAAVETADVAFLDVSDSFVMVAGRSKGFVKELYAAGAWLVLPATGGGCRSPRQFQL
jgi:hypothetical protein